MIDGLMAELPVKTTVTTPAGKKSFCLSQEGTRRLLGAYGDPHLIPEVIHRMGPAFFVSREPFWAADNSIQTVVVV